MKKLPENKMTEETRAELEREIIHWRTVAMAFFLGTILVALFSAIRFVI